MTAEKDLADYRACQRTKGTTPAFAVCRGSGSTILETFSSPNARDAAAPSDINKGPSVNSRTHSPLISKKSSSLDESTANSSPPSTDVNDTPGLPWLPAHPRESQKDSGLLKLQAIDWTSAPCWLTCQYHLFFLGVSSLLLSQSVAEPRSRLGPTLASNFVVVVVHSFLLLPTSIHPPMLRYPSAIPSFHRYPLSTAAIPSGQIRCRCCDTYPIVLHQWVPILVYGPWTCHPSVFYRAGVIHPFRH